MNGPVGCDPWGLGLDMMVRKLGLSLDAVGVLLMGIVGISMLGLLMEMLGQGLWLWWFPCLESEFLNEQDPKKILFLK